MSLDRRRRICRIALLSAIALGLSYVETTIPLPLVFPGAKLGLANIAVLVALFAFDARCAVAVAVVKVLAAGFLFGSPLMLAYSLGGTALALCGMLALKLVPGISITVVSMASAVLHNTGQVLVACALFNTPAVLVSLPPLAAIALVTGGLTGVVAAAVLADWGAEGEGDAGAAGAAEGDDAWARGAEGVAAFGVYRAGTSLAHRLDARVKITFVVMFFVAAFAASGTAALCLVAVAAIVAMAASGAGVRQALSWLAPFWGLFLFVAVFDVLFTRTGDVLWAAGAVTVTTGGVSFAVESVARFACMVLGTSSLMATTSPEDLTTGVGGLLAPLSRVGLRTDGAVLALSLTLRFVPVVAGEFAAAKRAHDERVAAAQGPAEQGAGDTQETPNDAQAAPKGAEQAGEGGRVGIAARVSGLVDRMKDFGLAFAPAFSSALRRADALAETLDMDEVAAVSKSPRAFSTADRIALAASFALPLAVFALSFL